MTSENGRSLPFSASSPDEAGKGSPPSRIAPVDRAVQTAAECNAAGGQWAGDVQGRGRLTGCLLPTSDADKVCSDSTECQSVCLYDAALDSGGVLRGHCYRLSQYKGCGILTKRGVEQRVLCLD
jgi:hypothetical protein